MVDTRWFPLVLQGWPAGIVDSDLDEFFNALDEVARRALRHRLHYVVVVWGRSDLDMAQRRRIARWVRGQAQELRERNAGTFVYLESSMQRAAVTALRWLLPELQGVKTYGTLEEAVKAAVSTLQSHNPGPTVGVDEILRSIGDVYRSPAIGLPP